MFKKVVHIFGKIDRFLYAYDNPKAKQWTAGLRRVGKCNRCGACCLMLLKCPRLEFDENGLAICKDYNTIPRPINCRVFPKDESDLREVKLLTGKECGFKFIR